MRLSKEELQRIEEMSANEKTLWSQGYHLIAGVDEAGRGPLAGPVVAAACILPAQFRLAGINDSKQLTKEMRAKLYRKLVKHPKVLYGIGIVDEKTIDEVNILQASFLAMKKAIAALSAVPQYVLVDGPYLPPNLAIQGRPLIKGDAHSISIAAASILAKYTRDQLMEEAHKKYPMYFFHQHKGYGTQMHLQMLQLHGPCPIHRHSFEPIRELLGGKELSSYAMELPLDFS